MAATSATARQMGMNRICMLMDVGARRGKNRRSSQFQVGDASTSIERRRRFAPPASNCRRNRVHKQTGLSRVSMFGMSWAPPHLPRPRPHPRGQPARSGQAVRPPTRARLSRPLQPQAVQLRFLAAVRSARPCTQHGRARPATVSVGPAILTLRSSCPCARRLRGDPARGCCARLEARQKKWGGGVSSRRAASRSGESAALRVQAQVGAGRRGMRRCFRTCVRAWHASWDRCDRRCAGLHGWGDGLGAWMDTDGVRRTRRGPAGPCARVTGCKQACMYVCMYVCTQSYARSRPP